MTAELDQHIESGNFFLKENKLTKAIVCFKEALDASPSQQQQLELHKTLGKLYQKTNDTEGAITHFSSALSLLADNHTEHASLHNILASLHHDKQPDKALTHYKTALGIFEQLTTDGNAAYTPHLANTHYAMAELYHKLSKPYDAKKHYKESIKLYSRSSELQNDLILSGCYYQLGGIYTDEFNLHDAKLSYLKALDIYTVQSATHSGKFNPLLAATHNNLGVTFKSMGDLKKAHAHYEAALTLYAELVTVNKEVFSPFRASTLTSLAILASENKNIDQAISYTKSAIKIYEALVDSAPELYTHYLATALHNLGLFYYESLNFNLAESWFLEALSLRKHIAEKQPEQFNLDVCATALNLVELYQTRLEETLHQSFKNHAVALLATIESRLNAVTEETATVKSMRSDLRYYQKYFDKIKINALRLHNVLEQVDALLEDIESTRSPEEKLAFQSDIVQLLEAQKYHLHSDEAYLNELGYAYNDLGWLQLRTKQYNDAKSTLTKALDINQPIRPLSCNLGHTYLLLDAWDEAKAYYMDYLSQKNDRPGELKQMIEEDIKILEADGIPEGVFKRVKAMLDARS